ncbi:unnamed protein product [Lampetra planeri]
MRSELIEARPRVQRRAHGIKAICHVAAQSLASSQPSPGPFDEVTEPPRSRRRDAKIEGGVGSPNLGTRRTIHAEMDSSRPMISLLLLLLLIVVAICSSGSVATTAGQGPVFVEEPGDVLHQLEGGGNRHVALRCNASGTPPPTYRWFSNGSEVELTDGRHSVQAAGTLVVATRRKGRTATAYSCLAANRHGAVRSRTALVLPQYLDPFPVEERDPVHVRLHAGLVLVCAPPPHSPGLELRFRWLFNEFPALVQQDARRYVSQATGDLYVARAEAGDGGRYSCYVTASIMGSHTSVLSSFVSLGLKKDATPAVKLAPHVELALPPVTRVLAGRDVRLECFALGNPVPEVSWRRVGAELPAGARVTASGAALEMGRARSEHGGTYECEARNAKGSARSSTLLVVNEPPSWVRGIPPAELDIGDRLSWACEARGHPAPFYRWLRDGEPLRPGGSVELGDDGTLTISAVNLSHSGMYQCEAWNGNGTIYSAAELRVREYAPHFGSSPDPGTAHVVRGGAATLLCRPRASPHATISWERHGAPILNSSRVFVRERDSSLLIVNATEDADGGPYTCVAENARGRANLTLQLHVQEPTWMSRPPTDLTANVSDSVLLPCQASTAAGMSVTYTWEALGRTLDPGRDAEKFWIASQSEDSGDLTIVKVRLADSGRYTCTARTPIDSVSASATLRVKGPPGPPASVRVMKVTNTSAMLSWKQGAVNNSPIRRYRVEARTPQSRQWAAVSTAPAEIEGSAVTAVCERLVPWTEYEFRVAAVSDVGTSEQSTPSRRIRTNAAPPTVVPVAVSGGGGRPRELTITWNPVHPELRYGDDFGYVVSFRPNSSSSTSTTSSSTSSLMAPRGRHGGGGRNDDVVGEDEDDERGWTQAVVPHAETALYVAELPPDVPPYAAFLVRVGTFNSAGEGPRGPAVIVHSAEALPSAVPESVAAVGASASELDVSWLPVPQEGLHGRLVGYSVSYWPAAAANELSVETRQDARVSGEATGVRIAGLSATTTYFLAVRVLNGAGAGPPSRTANGTTLKPPPSQVPHNVSAQVTPGSGTTLHWDPVEATENESAVTGYKVLYWLESNGPVARAVLESERTSAWLNLTSDGVYTVEVRARSPGGDGLPARLTVEVTTENHASALEKMPAKKGNQGGSSGGHNPLGHASAMVVLAAVLVAFLLG